MICECYVSFETAKLLKEKGFDGICRSGYSHYGSLSDIEVKEFLTNTTCPDTYWECTAPTLQMAMKWLREVHKMHVEIRITNHSVSKMFDIPKYYWIIFNPEKVKWMDESTLHDVAGFDTYEKACDSAINYCLRKLV